MKKILAVLLALSMVAIAFAQPVVKTAFDGKIVLYDQDGNASNNNNSASSATFSFTGTGAEGLYGSTFSVAGVQGTTSAAPLYNSGWKAWSYAFDKLVKFSAGRFSLSEFRTTGAWNADTSYPGTTERFLVNIYPMAGVNVGVSVPFVNAGEAAVDSYKKSDLGLVYSIDGIGKLTAYANLDLVAESNVIGLGFTYTGVENLNVVGVYKGTLADPATHDFFVSGDYTMGALWAYGEFDGTYADELTWGIYAGAAYDVTDALNVELDVNYNSDATFDAGVTAYYTFAKGFKAGVVAGYNSETELYYSIPLKYSVSF